MPYLFLIELDYVRALRKAELAFVDRFVAQLADGTLESIDLWRRAHETGSCPLKPTGSGRR